MAQNGKLSDLVNQVDVEASKYASFDEYLADREAKGSEWQKSQPESANAAEENSSSSSIEKVAETANSSEPPSVAPVTAPTKTVDERAKAMADPAYITNGLRTEPAHPVAPQVTAPEPPPTTAENAPMIYTRMVKSDPIKWAGGTLRSVEEVPTLITAADEPDWWAKVYLMGREAGIKLDTYDAIIDRLHLIEESILQQRRASDGIKSILFEKLKSENSETRTKYVGELDMTYRLRNNKKQAERAKADRGIATPPKAPKAPKGGIGIAYAKQMAEGLGIFGEELVEKVEKAKKLDPETLVYIRKNLDGPK